MTAAVNRKTLGAATRWRFLSLALERPKAGWREELGALAPESGDPALVAVSTLAGDASEGAYLALLGPGGAASPRAVGYRSLEDPGRLLAELAFTYEAFGYRPMAEDPLDHVAVEAGFVAWLLLKEAYAEARGLGEELEITREARRTFLRSHLAPLARGFAQRLGGGGPPYLAAAAGAMVAALEEVREEAPVAAGSTLRDGAS